jgi:hypothetical protein
MQTLPHNPPVNSLILHNAGNRADDVVVFKDKQ